MRKVERVISFLKSCFLVIFRNRTVVASVLTVLCVAASIFVTPRQKSVAKEAVKLEKKIHAREKLLEKFALQALENPENEWFRPEGLPEDMVIYKYNADTIQSWANQFPINNDEVDVLPLWYRLNYMGSSTNLYNTPLAYLSEKEQYVNLGSAWYVVKVYKEDDAKVISGLLIKTDFLSNSSLLVSKINPNLKTRRELDITPINFDAGGIVIEGYNGEPLFSVIDEVHSVKHGDDSLLKWISVFFALLAIFSYFINNRTFKALWIYLAGLTILRIITYILGNYLRFELLLFSPTIYADTGIFSSLGSLLLNNLYIFLVVHAFFIVRRRIVIFHKRLTNRGKWLLYFALFSAPVILVIYIHLTLCSLIMNSNIMFELYRLTELSIYTIISYFSYGLLFIALLLLIYMCIPYTRTTTRATPVHIRQLLLYVLLVSLYVISVVSYLGYRKELARCRVWTNKLSVERDLSLELQLRNIETKLPADPIIRDMLEYRDNALVVALLQSRLDELYLQGVTQTYEVSLTICRPDESLMYNQGQRVVDCDDHFLQVVNSSGSSISDKYMFFFLNNYNGRVSYLGIFNYETKSGPMTLYIEINSRYLKNITGYSSIFFNTSQANNLNMPNEYSYAKYFYKRLTMFRGNYNYPMYLNVENVHEGYDTYVKGDNRHFVNKFSDDNIIVITRVRRNLFDFFISYSYLVLFYSAMVFSFRRTRMLSKRKFNVGMPKNLFRKKITYLITVSLVVSLVCLGVGSIWFSIRYYEAANRTQMEEKLQTVQSTLSDYCKYKEQYIELNTLDFSQLMDRMKNNTQVDINLFDPHGRLIKSTQPELFDHYILSSRMNPEVYYQLVYQQKRQVLQKEKIAGFTYTSLYTPIFNAAGKLIAYANIPYFNKTSTLWGDVSSIIAVIINIYILLMLAAIFVGTLLANSISKPLAEIGRKMKLIDVSQKTEHINYKNNDELGALVRAYNKMVDDLAESTRKLAQNEREHAWSEMARQIAHEIKNPLTPIRLSIQHLIRMKNSNVEGWENKFQEVANSILEQIDILSNTASEFSSFAKFYYEDNEVFNLCSIISEQIILFDTRDTIKIILNSPDQKCPVYAKKGQIIRVVVNLLSNAIQALDTIGRGYIRISIVREENFFVVSFEDNGPGVKDEDVSKLFKPNFTTKSSGTGLGLAISRNIIEQSGGTISYSHSELGGANFSFTLPVYYGNKQVISV